MPAPSATGMDADASLLGDWRHRHKVGIRPGMGPPLDVGLLCAFTSTCKGLAPPLVARVSFHGL